MPRLPLHCAELGPDAVYAFLRASTGPGLLRQRAEQTPDQPAYAAKDLGIYREVSWRSLWERAGRIGLGLADLGVAAGDRVALIGDAFPEWAAIDLGAQGIGAITYGIYPTSSPSEVRQLLTDGGAKVLVAEHQEYVDKVLPLLDDLPRLQAVVAVDTQALFLYDHERLLSLAEVERRGAAHPDQEEFQRRVLGLDPAAPATIVWTSGTTSKPKGAVLAHGAHLASAATIPLHYPRLDQRAHRTVAFLPLCHVFGRDVGITLPLFTRLVPHYGDSVEDLPTTLYEVGPSILFTVPRYLQKFASTALIGIEQTSRVKGAAYRAAMRVGRRGMLARWAGRQSAASRVAGAAARRLVFRPLLDQLGLSQVELTVCAGAPLPPETATLWQVWGINLCDLYGQTEAGGGLITAQAEPFPEPGDLGTPPPGWDVALGDDGEIKVRSRDLFAGYWEDPAETAATLVDGWLQTGDVGRWRDAPRTPGDPVTARRLELVDRKRDIITTAGGKTLSPTAVENALKASPYVNEAMVVGHGRNYLTALVEIDYAAVAGWADGQGLTYGAVGALPARPEVIALIERGVEQANAQLARVEQVKRLRLLPSELDPEHDGDPVTPTRKVKREGMTRRYAGLIDEMYSSAEEARIRAALHTDAAS